MASENIAPEKIGRSVQRVYRHYKKHYDDINTLFTMTGLDVPNSASIPPGQLPGDLLSLKEKADNSLNHLKQHTGNVDELAALDARKLPQQKPDLCAALVKYRKDLDELFSAIQAVRAKAPKPKKKATGKARTKKF
ncbi:hypothetical protein [Parendozoicomonas haliclonae]|uniref:Uncharacterized protein n=1 Tax=Parendozoicomonas haliclonae TaxID=1960125 RepID=A0A1X7AE49_9GAMM|nr:hypothetical protein [Parendozoicomonas haliclonae]SMA32345.1 hypothetical protein EHSB41UT_00144 [Parendozoicomonas haliclonae]